MHLVDRMTEAPATCLICGKGNVPNNDGSIGPFLDMERDVNWGDPTYLCEDCGTKIGAMFGMVSVTEIEDLRSVNRNLEKKLYDLEASAEIRRRKVREVMEEVA
jgi:hypothetical protein